MHPDIEWGVRKAHQDIQGWIVSQGIILPCVKMCQLDQRLLTEICRLHPMLKKPQQLSCKATLVFLAAW